jgi:hypothetical protein
MLLRPNRGATFIELGVRRSPNDLVDALMVKPDRHPARGKEDSHAITDHERRGVIHLESPPTVQFHGKHAERLELSEASKNALEVVGRHT